MQPHSSEKENTPSQQDRRRADKGKQRRVEPTPTSTSRRQSRATLAEQEEEEEDHDMSIDQSGTRRRSSGGNIDAAASGSAGGRGGGRGGSGDNEDEDNGIEENGAGEDHDQDEDGEGEEPYDPDQPLKEKRKVRQSYRDLTSGLIAERARDPDKMTASHISKNIEQANAYFDKVKNPAEAVLDSGFLLVAGEMAVAQARKLKVGGDYFDTDDFVNKIKLVVTGVAAGNNRNGRRAAEAGGNRRGGGSQRRAATGRSQDRRRVEEEDDDDDEDQDQDQDGEGGLANPDQEAIGWDIIGKLATRHTLKVPAIDFMLGPITIPQKKKVQKKQRAKQQQTDTGPKVQAQELNHDDIMAEKQTAEYVVLVNDILEREGGEDGINLFKFLINPHSFTQTVENIFFTSFLVRDNKASIEVPEDGDGVPIIFACDPPTQEDKVEGLSKRQLILELDMAMWKDAIEAFDITEPIIPTREYAERQAGAAWYG